jgi:hypothetical protein
MNILHVHSCGRLLGQIAFCDTDWSNELNVEILAENDIFVETGLNLEVFLVFLIDVTKLKHAISYFLVEERNLLLNTVPNADLPLGIVLLLLLDMSHKFDL